MFKLIISLLLAHQIACFPQGIPKKAITCGYEACPKTDPNKINVHYVPHTHDDVGWIKTVDQYYYGSRGGLRKAGVQYILDIAVRVLLEDASKRFIFVETAFFWKWWVEQTPEMQQSVKELVNEGRLEFIGGAWSMNDEATTIYQTTIDQFTWGLRRLNDTFGTCGQPKIGWQVDPFGHAREQASLMAQYGFDGLFFGRLDYQDKEQRLTTKTMEMIWETSDSLGPSSDIFTGALNNMYSAPPGYCFDDSCADEPLIDDIMSTGYNIDYRTFGFYAFIRTQQQNFMTNHVMFTMGGDFQYQNAHYYFKNSDKLIKYTNELYPDVNIFYSTPSCYLKSLNEANVTWTVKKDDFFPYASGSNSYWTGYFTSRPSLKRFERSAHNTLQVGKQLACIAGIGPQADDRLTIHREAQGVLQHHDAVAGTEKQAVAEDYARMLQVGVAATENVIADALNKLMPKSGSSPPLTFDSCYQQNISQCATTESGKPFLITVYNPLSRKVNKIVRVPVAAGSYTVVDPKGAIVPSQIVPIPESLKKLPGRTSPAVQDVIFNAVDVPPLGYRSYYVARTTKYQPNHYMKDIEAGSDLKIGGSGMSLTFDGETNMLKKIQSGREIYDLTQNLEYYIGAEGGNSQENVRSSGAYIFRPTTQEPTPIASTANVTAVEGPIVSEVHQVFSDWASQVVRHYSGSDIVEFEWMVGPIPTAGAGTGKEVISKFRTNLKTGGKVTTDSSGRQDLVRTRNFRPTWDLQVHEPVSGNYYPVTVNIQIDNGTDSLAVITDRAQGGGSINDGELEIMVHRRLLRDDNFGVDEPLTENAFGTGLVARGRHYVLMGPTNTTTSSRAIRLLAQQKLTDALIFVSDVAGLTIQNIQTSYNLEFSGLAGTLPDAVQLLTLEPWKDGQILIRLENIFTKEQAPDAVTVNLRDVFSTFTVTSAVETNLAANKRIEDVQRLRWSKSGSDQMTPPVNQVKPVDITAIELAPKEIRTFVVSTQPKN